MIHFRIRILGLELEMFFNYYFEPLFQKTNQQKERS